MDSQITADGDYSHGIKRDLLFVHKIVFKLFFLQNELVLKLDLGLKKDFVLTLEKLESGWEL